MVILKATSFLEGHKRDMGMTFRITQRRLDYEYNTRVKERLQWPEDI
jgi:hypothetical protein